MSSTRETSSMTRELILPDGSPPEHILPDCSFPDYSHADTSFSNNSLSKSSVPEAPPPSQMHLRDQMLYGWPLAVCRVDNGRKLNESFQQFLKERAECEEIYSLSLRRLSKRLKTFLAVESTGVQETAAALWKNMLHRSDLARDLAQNIRSDIIEITLSSTNQNHTKVLEQITGDATYIDDSLKQVVQQSQEITRLLEKKKQDTLKLGQLFEQSRQTAKKNPLENLHLSKRLLRRIQEFYSLHHSASFQSQAVKDAVTHYEERMGIILDSLEDMDLKRICCLKDALCRLMVYETSTVRNIQYDLDSTIRVIQALDGKKEVEEFLQRVKSSVKPSDFFKREGKEKAKKSILSSPQEMSEGVSPSNEPHRGDVTSDMDDSNSLTTLELAARAARAVQTFIKNTSLDRAMRKATMMDPEFSIDPETDPKKKQLDASSQHHMCENQDLNTSQGSLFYGPNLISSTPYKTTPVEKPTEDLEIKLSEHYHRICSLVWTTQLEGEMENILDEVKQMRVSSSFPVHRSCFTKELDRFCENKQFELPTLNGLKVLGILMKSFLDYADTYWDVNTARHMMFFCQQFYAYRQTHDGLSFEANDMARFHPHSGIKSLYGNYEALYDDLILNLPSSSPASESYEETMQRKSQVETKVTTTTACTKKRLYLYRLIYQCNIWSRVRFWEESLILTITECHYARWLYDLETQQLNAKMTKQHTSLSLESSLDSVDANICYRLLSKFGACMLLFGIMDSNVVSLIEKVRLQLRLPFEFVQSFMMSVDDYTSQSRTSDSSAQLPPLCLEKAEIVVPFNYFDTSNNMSNRTLINDAEKKPSS